MDKWKVKEYLHGNQENMKEIFRKIKKKDLEDTFTKVVNFMKDFGTMVNNKD